MPELDRGPTDQAGARDECERRSAFPRRDENAEVVRFDRVAAVARRLTTGGLGSSVAEATPGSRASLAPAGSRTPSIEAVGGDNLGNAASVRRPAAVAASTSPPTRLIRTAMASQDRTDGVTQRETPA